MLTKVARSTTTTFRTRHALSVRTPVLGTRFTLRVMRAPQLRPQTVHGITSTAGPRKTLHAPIKHHSHTGLRMYCCRLRGCSCHWRSYLGPRAGTPVQIQPRRIPFSRLPLAFALLETEQHSGVGAHPARLQRRRLDAWWRRVWRQLGAGSDTWRAPSTWCQWKCWTTRLRFRTPSASS